MNEVDIIAVIVALRHRATRVFVLRFTWNVIPKRLGRKMERLLHDDNAIHGVLVGCACGHARGLGCWRMEALRC